MADQDRRGEDRGQHDHTWAELPFRTLVKIVFKWGFLPGILCGMGLFAVGMFTTWYQALGIMALQAMWDFWYVFLGFFGLAAVYIYVNHWAGKRRR